MPDAPDKSHLTEISGEVAAVTYRNPENGYSVVAVTDAEGKPHTLAGVMPELSPGERVTASGVLENSNYGLRLRVERFSYVLPATRDGLERYLGSGLIPGVGPVLAKRIVDYFGDRTLEVLDEKPGRLREIDKIGVHKADKIIAGWRAGASSRCATTAARPHARSPDRPRAFRPPRWTRARPRPRSVSGVPA